jgi:predicted TPR repeat methyltransferase
MPQDRVQIGLEHHRAGRLVQAEACYREVLDADPENADAQHWLGVMLSQAGQFTAAIPLLEQAAAKRPEDAAFAHNFALALLALGRTDDAIAAMERAATVNASSAQLASLLAQAYLQRGGEEDAAAAIAALRRAISAGNTAPELRHNLGVALLRSGKPDKAIPEFQAAIEARPKYPSAYFQLAAAHRALGDDKSARSVLLKELELSPGHAAGWHALARLDEEAGNLEIATSLYRRAIRADNRLLAAHRGLADVLARQGRPAESMTAFARAQDLAIDLAAAKALQGKSGVSVAELQQRITPDEFGDQLHQALSGLVGLPPPLQIAGDEVTTLYERYADRFDAHLTGGYLQYRGPEAVAAAIKPILGDQRVDILDLGCGTGLCGPLLRPMARMLTGVDLSPAMIEKSRARNVYDNLIVGDLVHTMKQAPTSADLMVAADVLIYMGDLAPTFEAAFTALRPGGYFIFTVEAANVDRYRLDLNTRRYTHGEPYVKHLTKIYGFEEIVFDRPSLRLNKLAPVPGFLVVLRRPG